MGNVCWGTGLRGVGDKFLAFVRKVIMTLLFHGEGMRPAALNTEVSEARRHEGFGDEGLLFFWGVKCNQGVNICQFDTENGIKLTIFSNHLVKMTSFMVSY